MDIALGPRVGRWLVSLCIALAACGFPRPPDLAECTAASDCASPAAPFCVDGACAARCQVNDDCQTMSDAPFCQPSTGACVACLDSTACSGDRSVCDASSNICRACARDDECASGVCLEAEDRCAVPGELVFLRGLNATDNPACSAAAPCQSFAAALAATTPQRYVIHLLGASYGMPSGVDLSGRRLYIHGSDTEVLAPQGATFSSASAGPRITLGRMTIRATAGTAVSASNNGALELDQVTLIDAASAAGGSLQLQRSSFGDVHCTTGGILRVEGSSGGQIDAIGCTVTVRASRFATSVIMPLLSLDGGTVIVENNTFVGTNPGTDPLTILHPIAGSRFAFNSVVNFSGLDGTAATMSCDAGLDVSSNIFAWHSSGTPPLGNRFSDEINTTGGKVTIESNLIFSQNEVQDGALILGSVSGSRFAFNTMVNFSGIDDTAATLACSPGLDVSSNIFAWHSSGSLTIQGCVPHHSLMDGLVPAAIVGANHQGDAATFFVDLNGRDLHLSAASLARGIGEPGVVDVDLDGASRPAPSGSAPDAGAYERP